MKHFYLLFSILFISTSSIGQNANLCKDWVKPLLEGLSSTCSTVCPGDLNNGDLLFHEFGTVDIFGTEYLYHKTTGGSFDFSCTEWVFYDCDGTIVETCFAGFGLPGCVGNFFNSPNEIFNLPYNALWTCDDPLPQCNQPCAFTNSEVLCLDFVREAVNSFTCGVDANGESCNVTVTYSSGQGYIEVELTCSPGNNSLGNNDWIVFDCNGNILQRCDGYSFGFSCDIGDGLFFGGGEIIYSCIDDGPLPQCGQSCDFTNEEVLCLPFIQEAVDGFICGIDANGENCNVTIFYDQVEGYIKVSMVCFPSGTSLGNNDWIVFDCFGNILQRCDGYSFGFSCDIGDGLFFGGGILVYSCTDDGALPGCGESCICPDLIDPNIFCTQIDDPVCGCDGVTYSNACIAQYQNGVTSWTKGPCNNTNDDVIRASCEDFNANTFDDYINDNCECEGHLIGCICPDLIGSKITCPQIYEPVCGCDGVTYSNDCFAENAGVIKWTAGECKSCANEPLELL